MVPPSSTLSIGVPVRNGGDLLDRALASIAAQTHPRLEVLLSDNASDDDTGARCRAFVDAHPFARYVRHDVALTANDHFRYVFEATTGDHFAWVAHDDDRSADFGVLLGAALDRNPVATLAYPTLLVEREDGTVVPSPFSASSMGMGFHERVRWPWWQSCLPIYGVLRRSALDGYRWHDGNGSPDVPLLSFVAVAGEIVHVPGPTLTYRLVRKRSDQLAGDARLRVARINRDAAAAGVEAAARHGERRSQLGTFARLEVAHLVRRATQLVRRGRTWEPLVAGPRQEETA